MLPSKRVIVNVGVAFLACEYSCLSLAKRPSGSLRSKRFRGVFCTKKPIFLFLDAREMGRERKKGGGRGGEGEKRVTFASSLLTPPPCFCSRPISRASKTTKIGFFSEERHGNACYAGSCIRRLWNLNQKRYNLRFFLLVFYSGSYRVIKVTVHINISKSLLSNHHYTAQAVYRN